MIPTIDRRVFLRALPAFAMAPRFLAQAAKSQLKIRGFNHVALKVSDPKRSIDFYQGLFGMPMLAGSDGGGRFGIRPGQYLGMSSTNANLTPGVDHFCLSVDDFNVDRIVKTLAEHGVEESAELGAMKVQISRDAPELSIGDPDGIVVQLQTRVFDPAWFRRRRRRKDFSPPRATVT